MSGLLSVLETIGKFGVFLVVLILLLAVAFLIYVSLPPWFRNYKFNAFKRSKRRK